jgi:hypothetical protein
MSENSRLFTRWTDNELILLLDLYYNGNRTDSHNHDDIARFLGRYNPQTGSNGDGSVNQKIGEIMGCVDASRVAMHPGRRIIALIDRFNGDTEAIRSAARDACRALCQHHEDPLPAYVVEILR